MMTLVELCQALAKNVGIDIPTSIIGATDRTRIELLQCANETGDELARRVDWGELRQSQTLTGDGTALDFTLNSTFQRLSPGVSVIYNDTKSIVRQLTVGEWYTLTAVQGIPRYFLMEGLSFQVWPHMASGKTVAVKYQTGAWCARSVLFSSYFVEDTNTPRIPDRVFLQGMIVRWRRQKGMDYADFEAEYEASLAQYADFDDGARL